MWSLPAESYLPAAMTITHDADGVSEYARRTTFVPVGPQKKGPNEVFGHSPNGVCALGEAVLTQGSH